MLLEAPGEFGQLKVNNKTVRFYQLFPLYEEERVLKESEGLGKLFHLFQDNSISQVINPHRLNVGES